ncbi:5-carboxymethyl-2-hydroxymuconate Delta-isomerase [Caldimonas tepidiphila]|uniref:5-carboxymethyl-2-hydroxymuconate Delta-isomerase n=1 Tax=Caldimonas tepidiphila TaxID=2315841 RepID=UPI000E5BD200|nr:5-carboxymethyl-2-hydroxymuconate isomerase [Caldimonas tepidiphila]
MPHLVIEYTGNLDADPTRLLAAANEALLGTGEFGETDIKSRCVRLEHYRHGVEARRSVFVHATLSILSGRTVETRKRVAQALAQALAACVPPCADAEVPVTVDLREMQRETFGKAVLPPG